MRVWFLLPISSVAKLLAACQEATGLAHIPCHLTHTPVETGSSGTACRQGKLFHMSPPLSPDTLEELEEEYRTLESSPTHFKTPETLNSPSYSGLSCSLPMLGATYQARAHSQSSPASP